MNGEMQNPAGRGGALEQVHGALPLGRGLHLRGRPPVRRQRRGEGGRLLWRRAQRRPHQRARAAGVPPLQHSLLPCPESSVVCTLPPRPHRSSVVLPIAEPLMLLYFGRANASDPLLP